MSVGGKAYRATKEKRLHHTYFAIVGTRGHKVAVAVEADARDALRVLVTCWRRRGMSREGD